MRPIDADKLSESKFHPLPYTHITPTDVNAEAYKRGWNDAIDAIIADAPTVEEPQWIPCSERLPEARRSVILSTKDWTGEGCYWETTEHHVIWKGYRWNATYWDDEVIAWMPLPSPYQEEGDAE